MKGIHEVDNRKLKLLQMKEKIVLKEKMLVMKEKKKRVKQFSEIGKLAFDSNIDQLEHEILLGAFLEIASQVTEKSKIDHWRNLARKFSKDHENERSALIILFQNPPSEEIKESLKEMKFRWNKFRGEYYGYGDKKVLSDLLKSAQAKIEVASHA
ncbi:MAG: hypothetical protein ACHQUC_06750 [Chlamydiales bacterium]